MIASHLPVTYCSDPDVQVFVEIWASEFPFIGVPPSAYEIFMAARAHYGDYRCLDLMIRQH